MVHDLCHKYIDQKLAHISFNGNIYVGWGFLTAFLNSNRLILKKIFWYGFPWWMFLIRSDMLFFSSKYFNVYSKYFNVYWCENSILSNKIANQMHGKNGLFESISLLTLHNSECSHKLNTDNCFSMFQYSMSRSSILLSVYLTLGRNWEKSKR